MDSDWLKYMGQMGEVTLGGESTLGTMVSLLLSAQRRERPVWTGSIMDAEDLEREEEMGPPGRERLGLLACK